MTKEEVELFFGINISILSTKGCWIKTGTDWSNYGSIRKKPAHRLVYELCVGPLIAGREICHNCDRKGCINPDHLFQGTHGDNMQDAKNKYRVKGIYLGSTRRMRKQQETVNAYWSSIRRRFSS